ncbi:hypothetical protein GCM10017774_70020 [Lentzea cavernae]|uniref:Uncharacterized protein n=1 Tax=Lentzea cavernae TaxID=2020703 RepID=A0ABQ3MPM1_9PSEU|nr:hypothetical protein GCM10017774_70020 [Lentzea cavernae]
MSSGVGRKLWTTRDLQEAAAAGALFEDFEESEEDDEEDDEEVEVDFVSEDFFSGVDVVEADALDEPERLSVR